METALKIFLDQLFNEKDNTTWLEFRERRGELLRIWGTAEHPASQGRHFPPLTKHEIAMVEGTYGDMSCLRGYLGAEVDAFGAVIIW